MKDKRTEKPGVMIYGDLRSTISMLDDAQAGQLFRAILDYGMDGIIPQLPSPLYLLWPMIQMRLDADNDRYYDVVNKRSYAAYVRWAKEKNQTPLSYERWLEKDAHLLPPEEAPMAHAPALSEPTPRTPFQLDPFYQDLIPPSASDSPRSFAF